MNLLLFLLFGGVVRGVVFHASSDHYVGSEIVGSERVGEHVIHVENDDVAKPALTPPRST